MTDQNVDPIEDTDPQTQDINPVVDPEPVDNSSRSRLGRKVAHLEENITDFMSRMESSISELKESRTGATTEPDPLDIGLGDELVTESVLQTKLNTFYQKQREQEMKEAKEFKNRYTSEILSLSKGLSEEEFNSVIGVMDSAGNPRSADDASVAARLNFLSARNTVLENKFKTPTNPLTGDKGHAPTGIGGSATVKSSEDKMPELTEEEKDFIRRSGLSDEDVKDALSNKSDTLIMK